MRVNEDTSGLVNDDDALVLVEDGDHTDDLNGKKFGFVECKYFILSRQEFNVDA